MLDQFVISLAQSQMRRQRVKEAATSVYARLEHVAQPLFVASRPASPSFLAEDSSELSDDEEDCYRIAEFGH